ncbi:MAG TPA: histidine triad nucleotide-binding protein [Candidatus Anaerofilum faecale]|nr:histidine triad nucleotide-binding protein [Anaerofilum sp. An201]OUP03930.1 histidine triad nucleotide-binding protein [Anaerofilum sp. An201]HIX13048.1 histidine triad nucleotide-binding protein [Candidatus Anaerofilum faecale]
MDCLFCKMVAGEIPVNKVYEDEQVLAFHDIDPQAPVHFLVIPKQHLDSPAAITEKNAALVGHIFAVIAKLAGELGLENGYRVVTNCGADGGQSVQHLHFHVLAKRSLAWPPG